MYISSDGTQKDVKHLNSEYLINALAKSYREVFNSLSMKDYEKYMNNIEVLTSEMQNRISKFTDEKVKGWE